MNILIIGLADSIWLKEYIAHVLLDEDVSISVISCRNEKYKDFYAENGIEVIQYPSRESKKISSILKSLKKSRRIAGRQKQIDVIHVHFADVSLMLLCYKLFMIADKTIITFWGSDLLRAFNWKLKILKHFLDKADIIQLVSENMLEKFHKSYGIKFDGKLNILDFGNPMYGVIDSVSRKMVREDCKKYWEMPGNMLSVHIGYNSIREQNHIAIVKSLGRLPDKIKDNLFLVFHFGYGAEDSIYVNHIKSELKENKFRYKFINKYMDKEDVAKFRLSADIFVYGQTTDAVAGSVLEYLYAGVKLIYPKWLDYSVLLNIGIQMYGYEDFTGLTDIFQEVYKECQNNSDDNDRDALTDNRMRLKNFNSWEKVLPEWKAMYDF